MKKYFTKQALLGYFYGALSGRLLGFVVGAWATGFVSKFFETRSIHNLWGLKSNKILVDKDTFENMEWVISLVIGYFIFEIFEKVVKEWLSQHGPVYYKKGFDYMEEKGYNQKIREAKEKATITLKVKKEESRRKVGEMYSRFMGKE